MLPYVDTLLAVVQAALPDAVPDLVASVFLAQIPHVDAQTGASLVDRVTAKLPAATWNFDDDRLDRWPSPVVDRAMHHIRALPPGEQRILALCRAAKRLTLEDRREALDGILDETLPSQTEEYNVPRSYRPTIEYLVYMLPEDWQEEWIRHECVKGFSEDQVRWQIQPRTEQAVRDRWARIDHVSIPERVPSGYGSLIRHLPADLRQQALARVRACTSPSARKHGLMDFDDELTDVERDEIVGDPWNSYALEERMGQRLFLSRVRNHLPRTSLSVRRKWLEILLNGEDGPNQDGLVVLLPSLTDEDHRRAADAGRVRTRCVLGDRHRNDPLARRPQPRRRATSPRRAPRSHAAPTEQSAIHARPRLGQRKNRGPMRALGLSRSERARG